MIVGGDGFADNERRFMARALELAQRGLYSTDPNPRVGCVIVKGGEVIGEGSTQPPGGNHAEVEAIIDARARGHDPRGSVLYVCLEPCSHFGRTPPCANALIEAGVARVVAAMQDPNPLVSGRGFRRLRAGGIEVLSGLLEDQARELNIGFVSRMTRARPWVRMKLAASLDAMSALPDGRSRWITGEAARRDGHAWRARASALLTGIGTVRVDDPRLDVRHVETPRQPARVLVDSRFDVPLAALIVRGAAEGKPLLVVGAVNDAAKQSALVDAGCETLVLPNASGKVDLAALMSELARRGVNELHVEAGGKLNGSLVREQCVDELLAYFAPCLLGASQAMIALPAPAVLDDRIALYFHEITMVGADLRVRARFGAGAQPNSVVAPIAN